jgi:uncharacterized damage-inducible protein DinB
MSLSIAATRILGQLTEVVSQIRDADFSKSSPTLSGSSIGAHIRHTLEFFLCFETGYEKGVVNYDKRPQDRLMETNKDIALATIRRVYDFVSTVTESKRLKLETGYHLATDEYVSVDTNAMRELVYNIEHAVHHMAIIKIAIHELAPYIRLGPEFGVAASTVRFNMSQTVTPAN